MEEMGWKERVKKFFKKYFWEGQKLTQEHESELANIPPGASWEHKFFMKHRKLIGFLLPTGIWWLIWFSLAIRYNYFQLFPDRYYMSITMIFGALVAGMTSEGGGAIAFPVMTLVFHISPEVARDFSLMIQSCGMTAAAFTIHWMKIQLEWHSIVYCSLGGVFGFVFGVEVVDRRLSATQKKMGFVSVWFAFAIALFILNMQKHRKTLNTIAKFNTWKALVLVVTGFVGGSFTSIAGSGVDVCSFSILTLLFHISEKVATPTSVMLMAINTIVGFYWRELIMGDVSQETWDFLAVCVPIVVICAPLGSLIASHFHRLVLATLIYVLEFVALVTGFVIVKPDVYLAVVCASIIFGGFVFFFVLTKLGHKLSESCESQETAEEAANENPSCHSVAPPANSKSVAFSNGSLSVDLKGVGSMC